MNMLCIEEIKTVTLNEDDCLKKIYASLCFSGEPAIYSREDQYRGKTVKITESMLLDDNFIYNETGEKVCFSAMQPDNILHRLYYNLTEENTRLKLIIAIESDTDCIMETVKETVYAQYDLEKLSNTIAAMSLLQRLKHVFNLQNGARWK